jgi:hypothetical protein
MSTTTAVVGETWQDTNKILWVISGEDPASKTVKADAGFESNKLKTDGWTRIASSPSAIEQDVASLSARVAVLETQLATTNAMAMKLKDRLDAAGIT